MEIKKKVRIINKRSIIETYGFDLEDSSGISYRLENCRIVRTDPGMLCYSGNITIRNDSGITETDALLWVDQNNNGILVYNE